MLNIRAPMSNIAKVEPENDGLARVTDIRVEHLHYIDLIQRPDGEQIRQRGVARDRDTLRNDTQEQA